MKEAFTQVREFHYKHNFPCGRLVRKIPDGQVSAKLEALSKDARQLFEAVTLRERDERRESGSQGAIPLARAALILEELGEFLRACADGDEVEAADAIADLAYVVVGTAVALDIPLPAVFEEVHRSNMTKSVSSFKPKGPAYERPNIVAALARGRQL